MTCVSCILCFMKIRTNDEIALLSTKPEHSTLALFICFIGGVCGDCLQHFKFDWTHRRPLFWMEGWGMLSALLGASIVAFLNSGAPFPLVYTLFLSSSSVGLITGNIRKSGGMIVTSMAFSFLNFAGLIRSFM